MSAGEGVSSGGLALKTKTWPFVIGEHRIQVTSRSRTNGTFGALELDGRIVAEDRTPAKGLEAIRNLRLNVVLPDGRCLDVEVGPVGWLAYGMAARLDGALVHESHPGQTIAMPERLAATIRKQAARGDGGHDPDAFKRNRVPLAIDIGLGLLFYVVAKYTDLSTAALIGAAAGLGLVVLQRFVRTDIIGGLALFGIVMLLISAGLAIVFRDDDAIKMRTTIVGLISAAFFLGDGLVLRGKRLGAGVARYLPYSDVDPRRLAIGMGVMGLVMAALNWGIARVASTDVWLFYHSFGDIALGAALVVAVIHHARGGTAPARAES